MREKLLRDFLMLWSTVDPIGTLALFAALTAGAGAAERRRTAIRATLYSLAILVGAIVLGQLILVGLGIRLLSLEVAGGIILFLFGLQMIFGKATDGPVAGGAPEAGHDLAVFPLAVPSIASPGAIMAAIVLTDNDRYGPAQQVATTAVLVVVLAAACALMLLSGPVLRVLGANGAAILVRVMGMILAALSVEMVLRALGVGKWAGG
jgi:multiple antibiotic resistance protein